MCLGGAFYAHPVFLNEKIAEPDVNWDDQHLNYNDSESKVHANQEKIDRVRIRIQQHAGQHCSHIGIGKLWTLLIDSHSL